MPTHIVPLALLITVMALASCQPGPAATERPGGTAVTSPPLTSDERETESTGFTPMETTDEGLFLPQCAELEPLTGLPVVEQSGPYQGWFVYHNSDYGFSLAFPADWELGAAQNYLCLRPPDSPDIMMIVGFKNETEDLSIQRTGVSAGEIQTAGEVVFFGQEILRQVLFYQGKTKAVLYQNATEVQVDGLVFTLSIDDFREDYDQTELPAEIQSTADLIVESFKLAE